MLQGSSQNVEIMNAKTMSLLPRTVKKRLVSGSGSWILLQFNQDNAQCTERKEFGLVRTANLKVSGVIDTKTITAHTLPESLQDQVEILFGFLEPEYAPHLLGRRDFVTSLADDRLIFLSTSGWLCTLPLNHAESGTSSKRHFFLPQD